MAPEMNMKIQKYINEGRLSIVKGDILSVNSDNVKIKVKTNISEIEGD